MDQQAQVQLFRRSQILIRIVEFSGKTSTILALAKQMYTPAEMRGCVLEVNRRLSLKDFNRSIIVQLNASDDRGIGIVRDEIQTFVSTQTLHKYEDLFDEFSCINFPLQEKY